MGDGKEKAKVDTGRFSMDDYRKDASRVVAHAEIHGRAVVVDDQGRERVRISIPTTPLPVYEPDDE
jgi:hypothetical protein